MFFGINHAFLPMALRGMGFSLVFAVIGAVVVVGLEVAIRRGVEHSKSTVRLFQVAFLLFFGCALFMLCEIYHRFHEASRVMATCPPQPAWVSTYVEKEYSDDHYAYYLYADIAPRDAATFPVHQKMKIELGVYSSAMPSPIVKHASGEVYLSANWQDPIVISVAGKYLCSRW